jgi:hypothetical protein
MWVGHFDIRCAVKQGVIEPTFENPTLGRRFLAKNTYTEFHGHPTDGLIADTRSQTGSADKRFFFTS